VAYEVYYRVRFAVDVDDGVVEGIRRARLGMRGNGGRGDETGGSG
jgi:hypothetical protein